MIIVESADASATDPGDPTDPVHFPPGPVGGIRIESTSPSLGGRLDVKGGNGGLGASGTYLGTTVCRGGEGGGGIAQLHSARFDASGGPIVRIAAADVSSFSTPTIDQAGNGYVLLPQFQTRSRARSLWIDTGFATLAGRRGPHYGWLAQGANHSSNPDYPLDGDGRVRTGASGSVPLLPPIPASALTIPESAVGDFSASLPGEIAVNPAALVDDAFNPDVAQPAVFTIVAAAFDGTSTVLFTSPEEGSMRSVLGPGPSTSVRIHPRPFRVDTGTTPDFLAAGAAVRFGFEGADLLAPLSGLVPPTPNLSDLAGKRFFRFVVDFDLNEPGNAPPAPGAPRPALRHLKLPFRF